MLVCPKNDVPAGWHYTAKQLPHLLFRRARIGSAEFLLELEASLLLLGTHRAAPAELGVVEAVHEQRLPDDQVQVHRPILAVFKGAKSVQDDGLSGASRRPHPFLEEEAMPPQPVAEPSNGRV